VLPQYLALHLLFNTNTMAVEKLKKSRANSARWAEKQMFGHGKGRDDDDDDDGDEEEEEEEVDYEVSNFGTQPFIPLCMFVLWGEEQGWVIVFPVFFMNSSYDTDA